MGKSFKKILSLVLAVIMVLAVPVISFAAETEEKTLFAFDSATIVAKDGDWNANYVGTVEITFNRSVKNYGSNDVILTIGTNNAADNVLVVRKSDITSCSFSKAGKLVIDFKLDKTLDHGQTYTFVVCEGAFIDNSQNENKEFRFGDTGNMILETMPDKGNLPKNPIEKLIIYLENLDNSWLLIPVIAILKWFRSL